MKSIVVLCGSVAIVFASMAGLGFAQTLDSEQQNFLAIINNYRTQNGLGTLQVSVDLQNSSQWMSNDMATNNRFDHVDSLGRDPATRMAAFGYTSLPNGENIAAGNSDAQHTFVQWQTACDPDPSGTCTYAHNLNMLNPQWKVLGIGRAFSASSTYNWYWTTDFGAFVDQVLNLDSGTANTIAKFVSSTNVGNSVMFESAGRIGLGNTSPRDFMHVSFNDTGGGVTGYAVQNRSTGASAYSGMLFYDQSGSLAQFQGFNNSTHEYRINNIATSGSINFMLGASKFKVRSDGDIDIAGNLRKAGTLVLSADTGIHIGTPGTHTSFYAAGVNGVTPLGAVTVPVVVDANGQLGTIVSSRRFKEDIQDMANASSCLFDLRPVTYQYKQPYADGSKPLDFGLIAEEVAETNPALVFKSKDGQIETVQYQKLTPMMLNELKKQVQLGQQQDETLRDLMERLAAIEASLPAKANATTMGSK